MVISWEARLAALSLLIAVPLLPVAAASPQRTTPSLGKLVGQSIMGSMTGTVPSRSLLGRVRRGELGGVILFGYNIVNVRQVRSLVSKLQQAAHAGDNPPLLIATDQEGGPVRRLANGPPFQSAQTMGSSDSPTLVRRIGIATGDDLRSAGVNVDLAPVVDVPESHSSFLGSRTFSEDPKVVARLGTAFVQGVQDAGVAATAKHFPGLGTATANPDDARVVIATDKTELDRRLTSFKAAIKAGVHLVMVSNASYPALDRSGLPVALSRPIVTELLRRTLDFHGTVITDTLAAPGPAHYPDACTRALQAGVDVLLLSGDEDESATAFAQIEHAAQAGKLTMVTLRAAYKRIIALKTWLKTGRRAR
jgi:beta-N-acetylhexosaminidase